MPVVAEREQSERERVTSLRAGTPRGWERRLMATLIQIKARLRRINSINGTRGAAERPAVTGSEACHGRNTQTIRRESAAKNP